MVSKLTEVIPWKKKDVTKESILMADVHVCLCLHVLIISVHDLLSNKCMETGHSFTEIKNSEKNSSLKLCC